MSARSLACLFFALTVAGCGNRQESPSSPKPAAAPTTSSLPSVSAPAALAPPGESAAAPAPTGPPAISFEASQRPVNAQGDPLSDLEILNQAVFAYNEAHMNRGASANIPTFKTEAEQSAWEAAHRGGAEPLKDLSQLVKAGLIKALPAPPPGKKFVVDPQTRKVVLADAR